MNIDNLNLDTQETTKAAQAILGSHLVRTLSSGEQLVGRIVETEAYHQSDPATHAHRGKTERNRVMFEAAGVAYVYFTYGMHYCFNIVTGPEDEAAAVLIRAVEPIEGIETMQANRKATDLHNLCSGPAKFTQAFAIDLSLNGHNLEAPPLELKRGAPVASNDIKTTTRIGISQNTDAPWRFYIKDNAFISRR